MNIKNLIAVSVRQPNIGNVQIIDWAIQRITDLEQESAKLQYQLNIIKQSCPDEFTVTGSIAGTAQNYIASLEVENERLKASLPPIEYGKNRYGLDTSYFRKLINRELNRPLADYKPSELARICLRIAMTADDAVINEREFTSLMTKHDAEVIDEAIHYMQKHYPSLCVEGPFTGGWLKGLRKRASQLRQKAQVTK